MSRQADLREAPLTPGAILRPTAGTGVFRVGRYLPSPDLAEFVEHHWGVRWDVGGREPYLQETLPSPCIHLVVEVGHSGVFGVVRGRFAKLLVGRGRAFAVRFRPAGFKAFWPGPVASLTGRILPLHEAFGSNGAAYQAAVLAEEDDAALVRLAEAFLRGWNPRPDEQAALVNRIVDRIAGDRTLLRVEDVVRETGVRLRTMQRLFRHYIGVSPKWVICRQRLHDASARLIEGEGINWAQLALELGYFDQAHFIRDFKRLVGIAPAEYTRSLAATPPTTSKE